MRLPAIAALAALLPLATMDAPAPRTLSPAERLVLRQQRHFAGALELLASRDLSALTADQRRNRAALVAVLERYRERGVFPHNYDFPDAPTPYFIDRKTGTLCAVGHLIAATGHRDLVERVASMDNNVWVPELADDKEFRGWLETYGLTLAEAARIQIPYEPEPPPLADDAYPGGKVLREIPKVAATASVFFTLLNATSNSDGHEPVARVMGMSTGALAIIAGVALLTSNAREANTLSAMSVASGALGMAVAARSTREFRLRARVTPVIPVGGTPTAGFSLTLTF